MGLNSALYEGWVWHRRLAAPVHDFRYRLFMVYLDLDEVDALLARSPLWGREWWRPARFTRSDYHGPADQSLADTVRRTASEALGRPLAKGPIRMLTHLRYAGVCFNPVTFYYLFDESGNQLEAVLAEINNTPWNERFSYVLPARSKARKQRFQMSKEFHVSPFMPMEQSYEWTFLVPGEQCVVHMENHQDDTPCFEVDLVLRRRSATSGSLAGMLVRYPLMTVKVVAGIYWQALRLRLKGAHFFTHPAKIRQTDP